jgi:hypothetical protein
LLPPEPPPQAPRTTATATATATAAPDERNVFETDITTPNLKGFNELIIEARPLVSFAE